MASFQKQIGKSTKTELANIKRVLLQSSDKCEGKCTLKYVSNKEEITKHKDLIDGEQYHKDLTEPWGGYLSEMILPLGA